MSAHLRTLAGLTFQASPDGIAQELRQALGARYCTHEGLPCAPCLTRLVRDVGQALLIAAGVRGLHPSVEQYERLGEALDVVCHAGLPPVEQTPKGQRRGGRYKQ